MANGRRSSAQSDNSSLILGILVGMVGGLVVAGAVAWHLSNRPNTFTSKEQREPQAGSSTSAAPAQKQPVATTAPASPATASGVSGGKQQYTFYKILQDGESPSPKGAHPATGKPAATAGNGAKASAAASYFLQAGSFSNSVDANKLKEKLAFLGLESSVQVADVPGKGTYYRVRLGPYHNSDELNKAKDTLKQNGINEAAQIRAQ